jgi:integrase
MRQATLTALTVKNLKPDGRKPSYHIDGGGLMLKVTAQGSKSWIFRYMRRGVDNWLGLGSYPEVTLAEARELAATHRKAIRAGIDIAAEKKVIAATVRAEQAKAVTFDWCSAQYIAAHKSSWRNAKSEQQWTNTLSTYASPVIGALDVARIETSHIMQILEPIWQTKAETASRLRGRIENVLDWATVSQHRTGDNPARLKGHLDVLLPARNKAISIEHHAALPYAQMSGFMTELAKVGGIAARACDFTILTAARSGEVRGATWAELDLDAGVWTIPAERMKAVKEHRVPLSAKALAIIGAMQAIASSDLIFPGMKAGRPLSDMSLTAVLRRMGHGDLTMHGFRSTFRDWAAEITDYPSEMAEMALAHQVSNKVEAAYRRGDMMEKRRGMMQAWADHCFPPSAGPRANSTDDAGGD